MSSTIKISLCSLALTTAFSFPLANASEANSIPEQGKALIQAFSSDLKGELKGAIKEGGFKNGIAVCSEKAPAIAAKYSTNQWQIKRTSLKVRNPANTASEFERETLLQFQVKKDQGIPVSELSFYQAEDTANGKTHRLMKAIPTQALCLGCHGDNLADDVKSELQLRYPADQATGFQEGDIRGAFSLTYTEQ
jgi:hypothetical protein